VVIVCHASDPEQSTPIAMPARRQGPHTGTGLAQWFFLAHDWRCFLTLPDFIMSIRYANVINHLPETKMRLYPTKVINIIGGPGSDKSLFSAAIVLHLSLHGKTVETIPDYAKSLVWQQNFEVLKNQYFIAQRQFEMLNLIDGQVHFLITECSLPQVLFYNENYAENICDVAKTREQILEWYRQNDNINILVKRGDKKYVRSGRFQDEEQAREVDQGLREILDREHLPYTELPPDIAVINAFAETLLL
jgi:hypothetical protein